VAGKNLARFRYPGEEEPQEKKECCYTLEGREFRHSGTMRVNRMQMVENLRFAFPDVQFVHRYRLPNPSSVHGSKTPDHNVSKLLYAGSMVTSCTPDIFSWFPWLIRDHQWVGHGGPNLVLKICL